MISTPSLGARFAQAAQVLATHLSDHALREPAALEVNSKTHQSRLAAQVSSRTVPSIATELLAWADTLTTITVQAWRPPTGNRVHLSMLSTLAGSVELTVYGGAPHDPTLLGELTPDECRAVTLGELRAWREGASR
jgi:hypothetical protein